MKNAILTAVAAALLFSGVAQASSCENGNTPICVKLPGGGEICWCGFGMTGNSKSKLPSNFNKGLINEDLVSPGRQPELIRPNR